MEFHNGNLVKFFPNPTSELLNINFTKSFSGTLKVLNNQGAEIHSSFLKNKTNHDFDLSYLSDGAYFVILVNEKTGEVFSQKIVKI